MLTVRKGGFALFQLFALFIIIIIIFFFFLIALGTSFPKAKKLFKEIIML